MSGPDPILRFVTYLAPSIPEAFFQAIAEHVAARVGMRARLVVDSRSSGPMHGARDLFAAGEADVGFLCSPSYLFLRMQAAPSVELVPAGFVFRHERAEGRPVYFSDVVVRRDQAAPRFEELGGCVFGYNDECSLSGYFSTLQHLRGFGLDESFFERWERTGSHLESLEARVAGRIDGAAIDSTVLALQMSARPELVEQVRVLESLGPFPIQPIVVRSSLDPAIKQRIADSLLAIDPVTSVRLGVEGFGLEQCAPIAEGAYDEERRALEELGRL